MNATALGVTFWLPPQSSLRLHVRHMSRTGRPADVDHGKATTFSVVFRSRRRFEVLEVFLAWSRREDVARSGGNAGWLPFFTFFARVGYWRHEPVVHSRLVVSFLSDSCFATVRPSGVEISLVSSVVFGWSLLSLLAPPAVELGMLCELVLPRGMPQDCVSPWFGQFASFLVPDVLLQMVVWVVMLYCGVVSPGVGAPCFCVLVGANVVALFKLLAFRLGPVWPVVPFQYHELAPECFGIVPFGALVHWVVPWVAPGACDSTVCCVVCLDRSPISGTPGFGHGVLVSATMCLVGFCWRWSGLLTGVSRVVVEDEEEEDVIRLTLVHVDHRDAGSEGWNGRRDVEGKEEGRSCCLGVEELVRSEEEGRSCCLGVEELVRSEEEVANLRILRVCLSASVATAVHIATPEEASARLSLLSGNPIPVYPLRECSGYGLCGGTGVCGFPTSWCVRGLGWFCLLALDLVEFLLLWLVRDWVFGSVGGGANFGVPYGVREVGSLHPVPACRLREFSKLQVGTQASVYGRDKVLVATQNTMLPPSPSGLVATPSLLCSGCDKGCAAS
ncbi:hypothetical protein Taro_001584 [Colocasia esculenta]|uniref:Uncharacterized protein n=1 Tax=Colocasia esculenta TaxID=4460 RepID=A0A843TID2_COLES|nr:hypothetical protein [Colocasia esculenta]